MPPGLFRALRKEDRERRENPRNYAARPKASRRSINSSAAPEQQALFP